jgi:hypothetical protein
MNEFDDEDASTQELFEKLGQLTREELDRGFEIAQTILEQNQARVIVVDLSFGRNQVRMFDDPAKFVQAYSDHVPPQVLIETVPENCALAVVLTDLEAHSKFLSISRNQLIHFRPASTH